MNVRVFGISARATLESLPEFELTASWHEDATPRWINVEAMTQDELRMLLVPLSLDAAILEACLKPERSDRLISHQRALYMEVPTHLGWDQAEKPYLSILCLKTTILTIYRDQLHTIEDIIRGLGEEVPLYARTSSALLYYLLVEVGKCNVDAALSVRAEAERLDQACHEHTEVLDPKQISTMRRKVSHYAAVHDDHTYCVGVLQTVESGAFRFSEEARFFRDMLRLTELSRPLIDGAEARVGSLQRDYELSVDRRMDSRLRFLTILSAVVLPLTLISGIYGMNFDDMPGMGLGYGYLIVITLMLATAISIGLYLYRRGWFE